MAAAISDALGRSAVLYVQGLGYFKMLLTEIEVRPHLEEIVFGNGCRTMLGPRWVDYRFNASSHGDPSTTELKTDAEKLAFAVATGDLEAAIPLADEVQMSVIDPPSYVHRNDLLDLLHRLYFHPLDHAMLARLKDVLVKAGRLTQGVAAGGSS